jgi:hypothetical protein
LIAGVYTTGPLTINISGVAALNPAMAGQVQTNPALAGLMYGSINEAAVPVEEGWVKLRGLDPAITKQDICTFFEVTYPSTSMYQTHAVLIKFIFIMLFISDGSTHLAHIFLHVNGSIEYCGHCMYFVYNIQCTKFELKDKLPHNLLCHAANI